MPRPQAYLLSLAITMAIFGIRYILHPYLAPHAAFHFFVVACLLVEYLVGLGPAVLSATLGFFLGLHFFIMPFGEVDGISRSDVIVAVNYAFVTLFAIGLIEYLRRTLHSNQLLLKVSRSRHKISLHRENERLHLTRKAGAAVRVLRKLFSEFDQVLLLRLEDGMLYPQPLLFQLAGAMQHGSAADAFALFEAEDRALLESELLLMAAAGAVRRELTLRLRTSALVRVALERIAVGGIDAVVLKLLEVAEPEAAMRSGRHPDALAATPAPAGPARAAAPAGSA
ncbi:protein of unknown function [Noviherbaspirillum humi]|uniref:Sensor protein KdpD transmembrane domain-containing protein n=2 Tax=Noviherbaspirillum humi TaxID=1688639 RepID=A0A239I6A2_9BURK|nr:protein of unknown function [Noviherbaspirillum humi]